MIVGKEVWYDLIDSLPFDHGKKGKGGARIRCKDVKTLAACIRWYASSKLGPGDLEFIDQNEWYVQEGGGRGGGRRTRAIR